MAVNLKSSGAKALLASGLSAAAITSALYLIVPLEGEVKNKQGLHVAYIDAVGVPTACFGDTGKDLYGRVIRKGMTYTDAECYQMLGEELKKFENEIKPLVKVPYASPFQQAGILSYTYNVGVTNFKQSTLRKKLNSGDHPGACDELLKWVYAKSIKLKGLETRRGVERQWCLGNVSPDVKVTYSQLMLEMSSQTKRVEDVQ
jgi:lysozyme